MAGLNYLLSGKCLIQLPCDLRNISNQIRTATARLNYLLSEMHEAMSGKTDGGVYLVNANFANKIPPMSYTHIWHG